MIEQRLAFEQVFDGLVLRPACLVVQNGRVMRLEDTGPLDVVREGIVTAGFLDLQVNGGGGVLWNSCPTAQGAREIAAAHRRFGTVGIFPTLITDTPEITEAATRAMLEVWGDPSILGVHFEGPHLSEVKRGTHAARFLRPLDAVTLRACETLRARDIPVMLTLAPEVVTEAQIKGLAKIGVLVALGHSNATAQEAEAGFRAGARAVTHLYNAMSQMQGRDPGLTGAAISSSAYVGIIADGHHVSDAMIALAHRARPQKDRMFLVSDAMPTVGGPDQFRLYDMEIRVENGRLLNNEGALAGAHTTMLEGVARLAGQIGLGLEEALRMAVKVPADLIGQPDLASPLGKPLADLVHLDATLKTCAFLG